MTEGTDHPSIEPSDHARDWSDRRRSTEPVERRLDDVLDATKSALLSTPPAVPGDELRRLLGGDAIERSASFDSRSLTMLRDHQTSTRPDPTSDQLGFDGPQPTGEPSPERRQGRIALIASVAAAAAVVVGGALAFASAPDGGTADSASSVTGGDDQPDPTSALHDDSEYGDDEAGDSEYDDSEYDDDEAGRDLGGERTGSDAAPRWVEVADAGRVLVAVVDGRLIVDAVEPAAGWTVIDELDEDHIVDLSFRRGDERVDFDVEIDDGAFRLRVRDRRSGERIETTLGRAPTGSIDGDYDDDDYDENGSDDDRDHEDDSDHDDEFDDPDEADDRDEADDPDEVDDVDDNGDERDD